LCNDRGIVCRSLRKHELLEALRHNNDEVYVRVLHDDNDNNDDDVASVIEYAENNHPNHASNNDVGFDNASYDGDYSDHDDGDDDYDDAEDAVAGGGDLGEDHQEQGGYVTDGAGEIDPPGTAHYRTPRGEETRGKLNCKFSSRENAGKQCV